MVGTAGQRNGGGDDARGGVARERMDGEVVVVPPSRIPPRATAFPSVLATSTTAGG